jgi:predicted transcriptional regulator
MNTVERLIEKKGTAVHNIAPDVSVAACARRMHAEGVGSLVVHDGDEVVGIVTRKDLVREIAAEVGAIPELTVREIMSSDVYAARIDDELKEIERRMLEERIHHVPVVRDGDVLGLITREDILASRLEDAKALGKEMEKYLWTVDPDLAQAREAGAR